MPARGLEAYAIICAELYLRLQRAQILCVVPFRCPGVWGWGMISKTLWAAFAVAFACAGAAFAAAPLAAYGRLPSVSHMVLSPNGDLLAFAKETETKRFLVIYDLNARKPKALVSLTDQKLRALQWADDSHLLITTSVTTLPRGLEGRRSEYYMAQAYDVQTNTSRALLEHIRGLGDNVETMNVIEGTPEPRIIDGQSFVFVRGIYFPNNTGRLGLFRVNLVTGDTRMVSNQHNVNAENWVVDETGNIVAEADYNEADQHWKMVLYRNGERSTAVDVAAPVEGPQIEGLSEDGTAVIFSLPEAEEGRVYQQISLKDGSTTSWRHGDMQFGELFIDIRSGRVSGGSRLAERNDYVFFDQHLQVMWNSVKAAFKSATNMDLDSWSSDNRKAIVHAFGQDYGDGFFLVDLNTHKADPIGSAYDGVVDVAPVKWVDYKAADGRKIQAYLTLPLNREPKNLPLIVLPHGGPHSRDYPGFDWFSQALASRGYVVLQPQFRGSDGFGKDLLEAGFGEFGKKMQTDLSDGVRALAAQGLVDPKRVCIVGASYGGYAALAGATLDTGVYRCAVSIAGLSDLKGQLKYWHWPRNTLDDRSERFWDRFLNVEDASDPKLAAISPIKHVDKVSIPILLIHGKDDTVVPFFQSDDMADELKSAKKPYEFVVLKAEDHWLSRSETRLQMLEATVKFLEANNPPN